MSGIVGSRLNTRGSGLVGSLGTDGQVFTSSGAGVSHTFEDAAGGGAWTYISTTTASTATSVSVTSGIDSTYDVYKMIISGLTIDTDDRRVDLRFYIDGSEHTASDYYYAFTGTHSSGGGSPYGGADAAFILANYDSSESDSTDALESEITLFHPASTSLFKSVNFQSVNNSHTGALNATQGSGRLESATAVTGLKFFLEGSGNLTGGTIRLYGINNS